MTEQDKKEVAAHFIESMEHEDLYNAQASRFLNLNPCYITWIKNEKYWPDISNAAWGRFEEWHLTREKLSEFRIPEGETIWEKKRPAPNQEPAGIGEHSPENLLPGEAPPVKQKRKYTRHDPGEGKSVKIILQKEEIEQLNNRINMLAGVIQEQANILDALHSDQDKLAKVVEDLGKKIFVIQDESMEVLARRVKDLEEGVGHLVTLSKQDSKPSIILFPKYIYKS